MARGRPSKRKAVKGENGENGIVDAADPPAKRSAPTKREKPVTEPARRSTRGKKQEETNGHTKEPAPIVEEVPVTKKGRGRGRKPKQVEEEIEKAPENGHPAEEPAVEETPEAETEDKSEESPVSEDPEEPAADEEAQEEKEVAGNGDSEVEPEEEETEKQNGDVTAAESEAPPSADEKEDEEKVDDVDDDEKEAVKDAEEEEKEAPAGADDPEEETEAAESSPAENDVPEEEAINGKIILSIEHCKSAKVYSKSATDLIEALKAEFGEVEVTVNGKKPRSKSFEINLITPDDTSVSVWTGVKKAPQKAKFPDSSLIIEEIRKHI